MRAKCDHKPKILLLVLLSALSAPAFGQCNSAPAAVDDEAFHEGERIVVDVLANDVEPDGEALAVLSVSTTCAGTVSEDFGLVTLEPPPHVSENCTIDYQVEDESENVSSATVFVRRTGQIFEDGFEGGDTGGWPVEVG